MTVMCRPLSGVWQKDHGEDSIINLRAQTLLTACVVFLWFTNNNNFKGDTSDTQESWPELSARFSWRVIYWTVQEFDMPDLSKLTEQFSPL